MYVACALVVHAGVHHVVTLDVIFALAVVHCVVPLVVHCAAMFEVLLVYVLM